MSIIADLKAIGKVIDDIQAVNAGPVQIEISAPIHLVIKSATGLVLLDTVIQVNLPAVPEGG
jgi:hypothetical protein